MGESRRRKLQDPNYGKPKDIKISFLESLEDIDNKDFISFIKAIEKKFDLFWLLQANYEGLIIYGALYSEHDYLTGETRSTWYLPEEIKMSERQKKQIDKELGKAVDIFVKNMDKVEGSAKLRGYLSDAYSKHTKQED